MEAIHIRNFFSNSASILLLALKNKRTYAILQISEDDEDQTAFQILGYSYENCNKDIKAFALVLNNLKPSFISSIEVKTISPFTFHIYPDPNAISINTLPIEEHLRSRTIKNFISGMRSFEEYKCTIPRPLHTTPVDSNEILLEEVFEYRSITVRGDSINLIL